MMMVRRMKNESISDLNSKVIGNVEPMISHDFLSMAEFEITIIFET